MRAGPGRRRLGADRRQALVHLGQADRVRAFLGFGQKGRALLIGRQHGRDQAFRPRRRVLRDLADAQALGMLDLALVGLLRAGDQAQQGRLAAAVRPDQADPRAHRHRRRGAIEQKPPGDPVAQILDLQHGGGVIGTGGDGGGRVSTRYFGANRRAHRRSILC